MHAAVRATLLLAALVASSTALAQAQPTSRAASPNERRTEIVVGDDDVIEASPKGPKDIVVTPPQKRRAFRSLIRIRTNFANEMLQSAAQVGGK